MSAASPTTALAQAPVYRIQPVAATSATVASDGEIHGVIRDEHGDPLGGAIISASVRGSSALIATSDKEGRYAFPKLPPGAYLVRAYLEGYSSPRGRYVQVAAGTRRVSEIALSRVVLAAGVGGVGPDVKPGDSPAEQHETSEVEWRISHAKRGVLKDAYTAAVERSTDHEDWDVALRQALGSPVRIAALFDGVSGQVNLLTTTSFDRPQDLFEPDAGAPRPIAYIALVAPLPAGDWAIRGSMTQGDIASWILAGSFTKRTPSSHQFGIGLSYAAQRYQGANADALAAMPSGSRNVGEITAEDVWTVSPRMTLAMGGRYASYDYLRDRYLVGGRVSYSWQLDEKDPLRVRLSGGHREIAPGAEEFVATATGLWLPPERTFSALSRRGELRPEKVDTIEVAAERPIAGNILFVLRAFRQQVDDQIVTLFGTSVGEAPAPGHYRVASAGDFDNNGWGFSLSRHVFSGTEASVDYTMTSTNRRGNPTDRGVLRVFAPAALRREERVHDVTASVNSRIAVTATRLVVVYKLNNAYADFASREPQRGARFDVQVNQEMPFLNFTGAQWEMLVGVRSLFRSELYEGSVYDELLVVRPPKRVTGGVTVRF